MPFLVSPAPCGLRGCKNRPALFPGQMSCKATKPGSVLHLSMFIVLFIRAPLMYCYFMLDAFCLLVVLVKFSVLAKKDSSEEA